MVFLTLVFILVLLILVIIFFGEYILTLILPYTGTAESMVQDGAIVFTDAATTQCIAVSLSLPSPDGESCLSLSLSATSSVNGLTLSPSMATICVVSNEGT